MLLKVYLQRRRCCRNRLLSNFSHTMACICVVALAFLFLASSCGESGKPSPGFAAPCTTPMAGVLGCPAQVSSNVEIDSVVVDACRRLVTCGILAANNLEASGTGCDTSSNCEQNRGGECIATSSGQRCHYPNLDYWWCTHRFLGRPNDPCDDSAYSQTHLDTAVDCILSTESCQALGLSFSEKKVSAEHRSDLDKYSCKDGKVRWTATICDNGILSY